MKRQRIELDDVADLRNLTAAFWQAARGRRESKSVQRFGASLFQNLHRLHHDIARETWQSRPGRYFWIRDPKLRRIYAPAFRDRVLHHALIHHVGPALDRTLIYDTYACRNGKGTVAAVLRTQSHSRKSLWYTQVDIRQYFQSISHSILTKMLETRIKGDAVMRLIHQVLAGHTPIDSGLPIGALTSQHFANFYLSPIDRTMTQAPQSRGYVRYMDDIVIWSNCRSDAVRLGDLVTQTAADSLQLSLKQRPIINRCQHGIRFCGFRVLPDRIQPTARRRSRIKKNLANLHRLAVEDAVSEQELQSRTDAILGAAIPCSSTGWLRELVKDEKLSLEAFEM